MEMPAITARRVSAAGLSIALAISCPVLYSQQIPSREGVADSNSAKTNANRVVHWQNLRAEQKYDRGAQLYQRGRYEQAAAAYKEACGSSNSRACTNLGFMYRGGVGVTRNYTLSAEFNRLGCEGGNALGCTNLAVMYWEGTLPKDDARAVEFFRKGCEGADPGGCLGLGFMYEKGQGVEQDTERAADLYQRACEAGNARSCGEFEALKNRWGNHKITSGPRH
jgi:TPR repeat protein